MRQQQLTPVFAEFVPPQLDEGVLYVSLDYSTASHLCACGCRTRIVTPLGPADWTLIFDGTVTLRPSIGNGQLPCRSHYLIRHNQVVWAKTMTPAQVARHLARDLAGRERQHPSPDQYGHQDGSTLDSIFVELPAPAQPTAGA